MTRHMGEEDHTSDTDIDPTEVVVCRREDLGLLVEARALIVALGADGMDYFLALSNAVRELSKEREGRVTLTWINGHPHKIETTLTDNPYREKC